MDAEAEGVGADRVLPIGNDTEAEGIWRNVGERDAEEGVANIRVAIGPDAAFAEAAGRAGAIDGEAGEGRGAREAREDVEARGSLATSRPSQASAEPQSCGARECSPAVAARAAGRMIRS